MIAKTTSAPSKKPYALDLSSFRLDSHGKSTVDSIWVGRKHGETYVCIGHLWGYGHKTLDEFMANFDSRYGGQPEARWDGDSVWAPEKSYAEVAGYVAQLDPILNALPAVPAGYDGWYSIKATS